MTDNPEDQNLTPALQPVAGWKRQMIIIVIGTATTASLLSLGPYLSLAYALAFALAFAALALSMHFYIASQRECSLCGTILDPHEHCAPCWTTARSSAANRERSNGQTTRRHHTEPTLQPEDTPMGSVSAMSSIERIIERHRDELVQRMLEQAPDTLRPLIQSVELENNVYSINTHWVFQDGAQLPGPAWDIDFLADEYPDCEVGY